MQKKINLLTIDPGTSGTGLVWWYGVSASGAGAPPLPNGWCTVNPKSTNWKGRVNDVVNALCNLLNEPRLFHLSPAFDHVIIEVPELWAGSARSHASTATDATFKLAILCGRIWGELEAEHAVVTVDVTSFVRPSEWKGQLTKAGMMLRLRRAFGAGIPSAHVGDAIGMGMAALGHLGLGGKSWRPFD